MSPYSRTLQMIGEGAVRPRRDVLATTAALEAVGVHEAQYVAEFVRQDTSGQGRGCGMMTRPLVPL